MSSLRFLLVVCAAVAFSSCSFNWRFWEKKSEDVVAEVGDKKLYREDLESKIYVEGLSTADSLLAVETFIKDWITNQLMYESALDEIEDMPEVDSLVENYRRSLIIYEFELKLVNEYLGNKMDDAQMRKFYKENPHLFSLPEPLVKGMLLVSYSDVPDIAQLHSLMSNPSEENIDTISSVSVKNAAKFDYFTDRWVPLSQVRKNAPLSISEKDLHSGQLCTVADSVYTVLLYVSDFKSAGDLQPFEAARGRIHSILMERNKNGFLSDYRSNLYESAMKKGEAKWYK